MTYLQYAEAWAKKYHDGHLSLLRFTTGWKAFFHTQDTSPYSEGYKEIWDTKTASSLEEACFDLLKRELGNPELEGYMIEEFLETEKKRMSNNLNKIKDK